ncbi:MAG: ABC transporter permease [Actinomycetia bacterium]|nr:ABC transporter permease [Actinomycetes bacterium]
MRGRSNTWVIFSEELRGHLRSRWYVVFTGLVVLLLVIAMLVVPLFQDEEGSSGAPASEEDLRQMGFFDESGLFPALEGENGPVRYGSRAEGLEAVARGEIESFYVITEDYLQSGRVEQYAEFEGRFPSNPSGEAVFRALLINGLISGRVDPEVSARVLEPAQFESFRVTEDATAAELTPMAVEIGGLLVPMLFAALLGTGLAVGFGYMVQSVAEEKESRLVEVVITSASPLSIMGGKLLALGTIGLLQAAVWIITAALTVPVMLAGIPGAGEFTISAGMWMTIIGCFVTGYFLTTTLAIFVGAVAPSSREAGRLGGWIPVLGFAPFWFTGLLVMSPDGLAGDLLSYIPFVAPTGLLVRLGAGGEMSAWQIAAALAGVAVTSVVVLWISTRVFRAAIFMRGQNFTRHNHWVALRDAD